MKSVVEIKAVDSLRPCLSAPLTDLGSRRVYYRPTDKQAIALEHEYSHNLIGFGSNDRAEEIAGCTAHAAK